MREHKLKTWPIPFREVLAGRKTFEFRRDDRGFGPGDILHLREWDPAREKYTGRSLTCRTPYVLHGPLFGVPEGYAVMSLTKVVERKRETPRAE